MSARMTSELVGETTAKAAAGRVVAPEYKPIPLHFNNPVLAIIIARPPEDDDVVQVDGAKEKNFPGNLPLAGGSQLATKAAALDRKNLPAAMATLVASSAALGMVIAGTSTSPMITFGFYAVFIAAITTVVLSTRGI